MNKELQQYATSYENEVLAYEQMERPEFIQQYIDQNYDGESSDEDA